MGESEVLVSLAALVALLPVLWVCYEMAIYPANKEHQ